MNQDSILFALVDAAAFMLSASFLIYVVFIVVPFLRHRPSEAGDDRGFGWHFFVPCLDEERVVELTVGRLRQTFPDAHVWCIDDASSDSTPYILKRLARMDGHVHVVTRCHPHAREGKGSALNAAWDALVRWLPEGTDPDRVIVGVVDADGFLDPQCLKVISGPHFFGDPDIGGVQIQVRVSNAAEDGKQRTDHAKATSRLLVRMQDMEFTSIVAAIQMLRHTTGSVGMGGNGQFTRLSALQRVTSEFGQPWQDALIEDFEMGLHIMLTGGRNEYCHDTWVSQQGPPTFLRLVRQRSRWGQGVMQCFRYLSPVLRSPNITTPAAVELTYFMLLPWLQVFGDVVYVAALTALAYAAITVPGGPSHWLATDGTWQLLPMFAFFGLGPLFIWGPLYRRRICPTLSRRQAVVMGLANWPYIFVHHFAVWWAFIRVLRSRRDWKKTERLDRRPALATALNERWLAHALPEPATVVTGRLRLSSTNLSVPGRLVVSARLAPPEQAIEPVAALAPERMPVGVGES